MNDFAHVHETPPPGAAADWTIPQNWDAYTAAEHAIWAALFERQMKVLPGRACAAFMNGLHVLDLHSGIPDLRKLNPALQALTGWTVICVPGLVPDDVFFDHLANRRFPAGQFIRRPDQLDYIQEPDVFHDVFGHVPMLSDPVFADYMAAYGQGGLRALGLGQLHNLARLYWYTVEFGLIEEAGALRIYGAGIVSSAAESKFALESASPNRIGFDMARVMRTPYRIDDFQQAYVVVPSFETLLSETLRDFGSIYAGLKNQDDIPIEAVLSTDHVFSRGDQVYADSGGRLAKKYTDHKELKES